MLSPDLVSVYLAVLAVALAAVAVAMLVQRRGRAVATAVERHPSIVRQRNDEVSVELVPRSGSGRSWRFALADGTPPTDVVIFTFRVRGPEEPGPWQHELVEAPLRLLPGEPVHLDAPPGDRFDVTVAWTTESPDGKRRGSRSLRLEATEWVATLPPP